MNLQGLLTETDETIFKTVVVHEFGHALGLLHEHQNKDFVCTFNFDLIAREKNWTLDFAKKNYEMILARNIDASEYDPKSIIDLLQRCKFAS